MTDLKPCPYCGGEAEYRYGSSTSPYVRCGECGCRTGSSRDLAKLAKAWNARWERTCHVVGEWGPVSKTQEARAESCSECGNEFGVSIRGGAVLDVEQLVELPKYCPNCGAKVVEQ